MAATDTRLECRAWLGHLVHTNRLPDAGANDSLRVRKPRKIDER